MSPLLYILYVARISDNLNKDIAVLQFADDLVLYSSLTPRENCKEALETAINTVHTNLLSLGLELSPEKTIFMHFNKKNILPGSLKIKIADCEISSSETARFLGIIFDYKMTFTPHINAILTKCNKALNIIKYLRGTWWGADPQTLLLLYKSFVRSILDYGSSSTSRR